MSRFKIASVLWLAATCLAVADGPRYGPWSAPANIGPVVNWFDKSDQQANLSRDGLSLYFASGRPGGLGGFDIYVSQRAKVNDPWGPPRNLGAAINGPYREFCPVLSPDGHRLYFSSNRPGGLGDPGTMDIYVSRRQDAGDDFGWEPAEDLGPVVNSSGSEQPGSFFEDDATGTTTLFIQGTRPEGLGGSDIYSATLQPDGSLGAPVLVTDLSTVFDDQGPAVRRDGLEMIFASNRPGSTPGPDGTLSLDLWVSTRASTTEPWSAPAPLSGLNSPSSENRPALSFDGTELYFTSSRDLEGIVKDSQDLYVTVRSRLTGRPQ